MAQLRVTPQELRDLDKSFKSEADMVDRLVSTITSRLQGMDWAGNAKNKFQGEWDGQFRPNLQKLAGALREMGGVAQKQADRYEQADTL